MALDPRVPSGCLGKDLVLTCSLNTVLIYLNSNGITVT